MEIGTTFLVRQESRLLARGIYTHRHPMMGELVRLYCAGNVEDWSREPDLTIFFPLGPALRRGIVEKSGKVVVPPHLQKFPVFKAAHDPTASTGWWCWDGEHEWPHDGPAESIAHLPYWEVVNDTALFEMLKEICSEPRPNQ